MNVLLSRNQKQHVIFVQVLYFGQNQHFYQQVDKIHEASQKRKKNKGRKRALWWAQRFARRSPGGASSSAVPPVEEEGEEIDMQQQQPQLLDMEDDFGDYELTWHDPDDTPGLLYIN